MRSVQWELVVVRISAESLLQTLILLKFIDISDFLMVYFRPMKLLLFHALYYKYQCFGKIFTYKFQHFNMCFEILDSMDV